MRRSRCLPLPLPLAQGFCFTLGHNARAVGKAIASVMLGGVIALPFLHMAHAQTAGAVVPSGTVSQSTTPAETRPSVTPNTARSFSETDINQIASQRAVYNLTLIEASGGKTLSATGTMLYSVRHGCSGWSTQQRLDIQSVTRQNGVEHLVSDYSTFESADGRTLIFRTMETSNGKLLQNLRGEATLHPDGSGTAHYEKPLAKTLSLPAGTLFPIQHTVSILDAARSGKTEISSPIFDGTSPDGAADTYITLLGWGNTTPTTDFTALNVLQSGRVHVAFFARTPPNMMPEYEIGMRYFANGVSDNLTLDFGDFRMKGTLHALDLPKPETCHAKPHQKKN
ncbi:cell envelope integrity EipB family protein [Acetobacter ascendens]|uniref:DUF1849 domain-containing protein n=1 Tax=Acetobacter ascendens TaxID=481146 RepID=A0A1D8QXN0_9PROT|nr:cell envelope integrity EipB family protein [Acetobacter ascendens]AOW47090.1 hypothetical protein A4S02_10320 [Acetobacter ascendens]AOW48348.1 hypothetical protein A4R89_01820 [Acetobacter ascendens]